MNIFNGMRASASGLHVERLRMNIIADNIANAETTRGVGGEPFQRKMLLLAPAGSQLRPGSVASGSGVRAVGVVNDTAPPQLVHNPAHPDADADGYVRMPNVNVPREMVDMVAASRAYEANAVAFQSQRQTQERALELLV